MEKAMAMIILTCMLTTYIFEDSDSLIVINDTLVICGDHDYAQKVHIADSSIVLVRPWLEGSDSLGRVAMRAPRIHITNASVISGSGCGFSGGTNSNPHGSGPGCGGAGNPGGGGGAAYGGAGGQGGDNAPGSGGSTYGSNTDTLIDKGSGGGAGRLGSVDGFGGSGGASITLRAQTITIDSSDILASGMRGDDGGIEAGGGGAGGGIMLWADTVTIHTAIISASGGSGGDASWGGGGGAGGGRIKIFRNIALDTVTIHLAVGGGAAGTGMYGTPEPGSDGSIYIGPAFGIHETAANPAKTIHVFPSLTRSVIYVNITYPPVCLQFYDCTGRLVKSTWSADHATRVDLSNLNAGVYFVHSNNVPGVLGTVVVFK
jgi:hypothetical protein